MSAGSIRRGVTLAVTVTALVLGLLTAGCGSTGSQPGGKPCVYSVGRVRVFLPFHAMMIAAKPCA